MEEQRLKVLKGNLKKGLYPQNLYKMVVLCKELAESSELPLPYYFLKGVFADMAERWEGQALPADRATATQSLLAPEVNKLLELIEKRSSKEELFDVMNDISSMCAKF